MFVTHLILLSSNPMKKTGFVMLGKYLFFQSAGAG
jgi:hypothetical protein